MQHCEHRTRGEAGRGKAVASSKPMMLQLHPARFLTFGIGCGFTFFVFKKFFLPFCFLVHLTRMHCQQKGSVRTPSPLAAEPGQTQPPPVLGSHELGLAGSGKAEGCLGHYGGSCLIPTPTCHCHTCSDLHNCCCLSPSQLPRTPGPSPVPKSLPLAPLSRGPLGLSPT